MKIMNRPRCRRPKTGFNIENGFTLIEMAISIMIVGLFLAAAVQPYSLYLKNRATDTTQENVSAIASAIGSYRQLYGYYPCPASLTAQRGNPVYGHSAACAPAPPAVAPPVAAGTFQKTSGRVFTYAPTGLPAIAPFTEQPVVRIGAVPFRELNLDESQAVDGYNNRIFYAVTERLTNARTFQPDGGGIGVLDGAGTPILAPVTQVPNPPSTEVAHFFIFSSGANQAGAYTRDGVPASQPCPAAGPESVNCNLLAGNPDFSAAQTKTVGGATHFDDVVSYFTEADMPLWEYAANKTDIHQKSGGSVGTADSLSQALGAAFVDKALIPGVANVSNAVKVQTLCDALTGKCFPSSQIGGKITPGDIASGTSLVGTTNTPPTPAGTGSFSGIACPAGYFMTKIKNSEPQCTKEIFASCPVN